MGSRKRVAGILVSGLLAMALLPGAPPSAAASPAAARSTTAARIAASTTPSGQLIAFATGFILVNPDTSATTQVETVRPDGTGVRQLTHVHDGKQAGAPAFSPDGRTIAYVSNQAGDNFSVWSMHTDGSHQHQLFGAAGQDFFGPRWSPGGGRLLVTRCDVSLGFPSECDILLVRLDGSLVRTIAGGHRLNGNASFSPDGRWVVFDSDRAGFVSAVWKVGARGGRPIRLTAPDLEAFWPNWSPDGSHLVISSNCCRPLSQVFTMRADGSHLHQLTHATGGGGPAFASYSPDGRQITYGSDELRGPTFDHLDLFVMNADGTHQHRILTATQNDVGGDWSRTER